MVTNFKMTPYSFALATMTFTCPTKNSHKQFTFARWQKRKKSKNSTYNDLDFYEEKNLTFPLKKINRLQDLITEISQQEKNFKILVYANGFKKIRITEKIIKELGIDTFAYERTNVGKRRRAMKEKVYYSKRLIFGLKNY